MTTVVERRGEERRREREKERKRQRGGVKGGGGWSQRMKVDSRGLEKARKQIFPSTARKKRSPANSFWSSTPNSGVGCHSLLHGIFPMRDWTSISYGSLPLAPPGKLELGSRGLYGSWRHRSLTSTFLDSLIISSHEALLLSRALWKSRIWGLSLQDSYKPIPVPFTVSEKL